MVINVPMDSDGHGGCHYQPASPSRRVRTQTACAHLLPDLAEHTYRFATAANPDARYQFGSAAPTPGRGTASAQYPEIDSISKQGMAPEYLHKLT
ncbi:MAG TPA: hypothetical protein VF503_19110 [Sphingobium sp.]|uniref:hypothetical protein n=1 Tax=Sphingobium sp. TaxID=1912891 RepID=UPI002ED059D0